MALRSWVESANGHPDFPIQNLPFGIFRQGGEPHIAVAIGDQALDLRRCQEEGLITEWSCSRDTLNELMSRGREATARLRARLQGLLREDSPQREQVARHLVAQDDVDMLVPAAIGDYTDFYASIHHATNVGSMFRPDNPLLPNYKWLPIGYHGRSSSIVASGTDVRRPSGQTRDDDVSEPSFGASRRLDYEMEVGVFIGRGNRLGEPMSIHDAEESVFGLCLVNDWSARDLQAWEYQPLGPFLAKSFATTVSPWVVTLDALKPFRIPPPHRWESDPPLMPNLSFDEDHGIDITVEVSLSSLRMRAEQIAPARLSRGNFRDMYWTIAQLVTHHTSSGCNLRAGDLLASGTVSGPEKDSRGCLLELTWRGTEPLTLPTGEIRRFLEDGDEVIMRGWCEREGATRIGFGECRGIVLPVLSE